MFKYYIINVMVYVNIFVAFEYQFLLELTSVFLMKRNNLFINYSSNKRDLDFFQTNRVN